VYDGGSDMQDDEQGEEDCRHDMDGVGDPIRR
jgi:hypothetical protein